MKKNLFMGLLLGSVLLLGACSEDLNDKEEVKVKKQAEEKVINVDEDTNSISYKIDGKEIREELNSHQETDIVKEILVPSDFETHTTDEGTFVAIGEGEYKGFQFSVSQSESWGSLEDDVFVFRKKASTRLGEKETVLHELDLKENPILKEKYDYFLIAETALGNSYYGLKEADEGLIVVAMTIKDLDKLNYGDFAIEMLKQIKL
jgi:hypothetical protein